MEAQADTNWLTGPNAKKLLRLYLAWPKRFDADPEAEAQLFFDWLKSNYDELTVVAALQSVADVETFLSSNPEVIEAAKFLKPAEANVSKDIRRARRVRITTNVFLGVFECESNSSLSGHTLKGSAFDVTPDGLGVEIEEPLPKDTILNITVAPAGYPIVLYRMTGEIRWVSDAGGRYHIGIKLFEVDDADRWQNDFDERFAAAV